MPSMMPSLTPANGPKEDYVPLDSVSDLSHPHGHLGYPRATIPNVTTSLCWIMDADCNGSLDAYFRCRHI